MKAIPEAIERLVREFNKLPGIGSKTSERFVFHLLRQDASDIEQFAHTLLELKNSIRNCTRCYTFTDSDSGECSICSDPIRGSDIVCVVGEPRDVIAMEKTGEHHGRYHVLGALIDHTAGIGIEHLRIGELQQRVENEGIQEIVVATAPTMEGEATALVVAQALADSPVRVTKIARGLPAGGDIQFADEATLSGAYTARQQL